MTRARLAVTLACAVAASAALSQACGADEGASGDDPDAAASSSGEAGGGATDGSTLADGAANDAALPPPPASIELDVPFVQQKPELPRGCEVTSLTMLLRYAGLATTDKMDLAAAVDKVPYMQNGLNGNPNDGFVGDMYSLKNPGYGVYHAPIERLADKRLPGRVVKLTGIDFDELLGRYVGQKRPVWVITNATFKKLAADSFTTWHTSSGDVQITWEEHSVVVTGYTPTSVFLNNPLATAKNQEVDRTAFREAWEQMGKQALTYAP